MYVVSDALGKFWTGEGTWGAIDQAKMYTTVEAAAGIYGIVKKIEVTNVPMYRAAGLTIYDDTGTRVCGPATSEPKTARMSLDAAIKLVESRVNNQREILNDVDATLNRLSGARGL